MEGSNANGGISSTSRNEVDSSLRIACLLPSGTEICGKLGLAEHVKGITHECDTLYVTNPFTSYEDGRTIEQALSQRELFKMTTSQIDPHTLDQGTIDTMVKDSLDQQLSLYTIQQEVLEKQVRPTLMITQSLCRVCAPSIENVEAAVAAATGVCARPIIKSTNTNDDTDPPKTTPTSSISIISLEPTSLLEVADTFVTVAEACGVKERGVKLQTEFVSNLQLLQSTVTQHRGNQKRPKLLLLEWLDPPFNGGHWVPEMISYAGCDSATSSSADSDAIHTSNDDGNDDDETTQATKYNSHKSKQMTWDEIYKLDPDCVLIACCGFDTARNVSDAKRLQDKLSKLRAFREERIYACNGNMYTARPGPSLLSGCAVMARVAFDAIGDDEMVKKLEALPFTPPNNGDHAAWEKMVFDTANDASSTTTTPSTKPVISNGMGIPDMEDLVKEKDGPDFYSLHKQACEEDELFYNDPDTGFKVFTEVAHKRRGKCCGSGTSSLNQNKTNNPSWMSMVCFLL
jgi:iron complex transport system substrate-binding protein